MQFNSVSEAVMGIPCASIDTDVAHWFRDHLTPVFANILLALSEPGSAICVGSIIALSVAWFAWKRHWYGIFAILLTVGGGSAIGETLKLIFQRPRPFLSGPIGTWGGYSLPSGHTIAATLLYGFLTVALLSRVKRRRWQSLILAAGTLIILSVGFSRIALGAHYVTDVLAAMTLGTAWIWLCRTIVDRFQNRNRSAEPATSAIPADDLAPVQA